MAMVGLAVMALVCLADDPTGPPDDGVAVDEQTAREYNDFIDKAKTQAGRAVKDLTRRYSLNEDQQKALTELVRIKTDEFLQDHGQETFDLVQRGKALAETMKSAGMGPDDVPDEIRRDLVKRALPLMDEAEKSLNGFADSFERTLDGEKLNTFKLDRAKFTVGIRMAKAQARVWGGERPAGAGEESAGGQPAPVPAPSANLNEWERYASQFVKRYKLDEVQTVQATELLRKYKEKAEAALAKAAQSRPASSATAPAGKPETMRTFQDRLAAVRRDRQGYLDMFSQFTAELDKIPTNIQRKLAEEAAAGQRVKEGAAASEPSRSGGPS